MGQVIYSDTECLVTRSDQGNIKISPEKSSVLPFILLSLVIFIPCFWVAIGSPSSIVQLFKGLEINWFFMLGSFIPLLFLIDQLKFLFAGPINFDLESRCIWKGNKRLASFDDATSIHVHRYKAYRDDEEPYESYRYGVYLLLNNSKMICLTYSSGYSSNIRKEWDADYIAKEIANILNVFIAKKSWWENNA